MSDPAYQPNETSATIYTEETWFQGALVMCVAYGSMATLSVQCFFMLTRDLSRSTLKKDLPLLVFVVLIFMLCTIFVGTAMQFTQQAYVDQRNFPGGPAAYERNQYCLSIDLVANITLVMSCLLADMLLLWRCTVVYRGSAVPRWLSITLASLVWLGEPIFGLLFISQIRDILHHQSVNFTLVFWCYSLALNVFATLLIITRPLVYHYRRAKLSGTHHGVRYTCIAAMIVESELLYTVFLTLFIIPFVQNHPLSNVFLQGLIPVQAISALMIIYRVADGQGWTKDTYAQITTGTQYTSETNNISTIQANPSAAHTQQETKVSPSGIAIHQEVYVHMGRELSSTEGV